MKAEMTTGDRAERLAKALTERIFGSLALHGPEAVAVMDLCDDEIRAAVQAEKVRCAGVARAEELACLAQDDDAGALVAIDIAAAIEGEE